ncbi:calcium-binding protein [Albimonas sp. CAU 1670]|uniref:calcium-binding protein n=1 Tax=Albimonas sp. CAU 1670 TaxID=3032599 RepID=UPI0023DC8468|nr:calcium-binding protein [Albimonas sp. CAU 1670]MDF2234175.1 calcium-binding protein [Albimonas sp. CAU 1670]
MPSDPRPIDAPFASGVEADAFRDPQSIALADGRILVVTQIDQAFFSSLEGRLFDADGAPLGDAFEIESAISTVAGYDLAALPDGGFAVAFLAANGLTVLGRAYDVVAGDAVLRAGSQGSIIDLADFDLDFRPTIAAQDDGFVFHAVSDGDEGRAIVEGRDGQADGDGGDEILTDDIGEATLASTTLESGNVVLVVDADGDAGGDDRFRILVRDAAGETVATGVFSVSGGSALQPAVAALEGGGFVVSGTQSLGGSRVLFQVFDAEAQPLSAVTETGAAIDGLDDDSAIAALPDGGFVVFYDVDGVEPPQIRGQRFDAAGAAAGESFLAAERDGADLTAASLADGRIALTWRVEGEDAIETRIFAAPILTEGTDGDDVLAGTPGDDILSGGLGDDSLIASAGVDVLDGGAGLDTADYSATPADVNLQVFLAIDPLGGGAPLDGFVRVVTGDDILTPVNDERDVLIGIERFVSGEGDDEISGADQGDDVVLGGGGADRIFGLGGDDDLSGGEGADRIEGGDGDDRLGGGKGRDLLAGGAGADEIRGGDGNDAADYSDSAAGVDVDLTRPGAQSGGDAQGDVLTAVENLQGSDVADVLRGDGGANILIGLGGDDRLSGRGGADSLDGGAGEDQLRGAGGGDLLRGGEGDDALFGQNGADALEGEAGDDRLEGGDKGDDLSGGGGADALFGQDGGDALAGDGGADLLRGGKGGDVLKGGGGADDLGGGTGKDTLKGGGGDDLLDGGAGRDKLTGGGGDDVFVYARGHGKDEALDYQSGADSLRLDADLFRDPAIDTGQEVVDAFATLSGNGRVATFAFGGGDVLTLRGDGPLDLDQVAADIGIF